MGGSLSGPATQRAVPGWHSSRRLGSASPDFYCAVVVGPRELADVAVRKESPGGGDEAVPGGPQWTGMGVELWADQDQPGPAIGDAAESLGQIGIRYERR